MGVLQTRPLFKPILLENVTSRGKLLKIFENKENIILDWRTF